ncbi:MAG TPA: histidine kinase [Candidatus Limnocylindria bacterium]|nr:histidine kinase [Candidatus Limnocylindria bacterium]
MNPASGNRRITRKVAMVATVLGLWGALVLLFVVPLVLTNPVSWRQAVGFAGSFWALWLLFLPAVAWLSFRFPIERKRLLRNIGLHLLACLLIVATNRAAVRAVLWSVVELFPRPQRSEMPRPLLNSRPGRLPPPGMFSAFLSLRAALDVLIFWSLVGVCQAITNFRRSRERERRAVELEARLTSAKLQALRGQLNPHFLFNTLNSIAALVYVNPRAADEMLGDLSELLRRSLDSMEEQEIPLAQELEFIWAYIGIEQKRFGERLRVEQSVPDELMKALVPALILQPLVENAIRHGIEPRRGPGLISIEAKQEGRHLHLIVRDNGRGLPGAELNSSGRRGIGLANTEARLLGLYGQDQRFSFGKAEPQGCQVHIHLPFHWEPVPLPAVSDQPAA